MQTYIIAEIGSNHVNDMLTASKLIQEAVYAGCNAVKMQAFNVDRLWKTEEAANMRRAFEVTPAFVEECAKTAEAAGIDFLCTPFDPDWVRRLDGLVTRWKVASAHVWDTDLLDAMLKTNKQMLVSMGAVADDRVQDAIKRIQYRAIDLGVPIPEIVPLLCVSKYPAACSDYDLRRWLHRAAIREHGTTWGISDHTTGIGTAIAAVAVGASYVEKHIALYQQPKSPDDGPHALRPQGLRSLVAGIRQAEASIIGSGASTPSTSQFPPERRIWR